MRESIFEFLENDNSEDILDLIETGDLKLTPRHSFTVFDSKESLTPLSAAIVSNQNVDVIDAILQGQVYERSGDDGNTPLHFAASMPEKEEIIEILLKNGADVNKVNEKNQTALDIAIDKGYYENVAAMMDFCYKKSCFSKEQIEKYLEKARRDTRDSELKKDLREIQYILEKYLRKLKSYRGGESTRRRRRKRKFKKTRRHHK